MRIHLNDAFGVNRDRNIKDMCIQETLEPRRIICHADITLRVSVLSTTALKSPSHDCFYYVK